MKHLKKEANAMLNKSLKKVLAVALLSTIGLAACSKDIKAKPTNYDDKLLTFSDNADVYHNTIKIIEDAYRDGSLASAVLDDILYQYSVSVFGRYNRVAEPFNLGENEITLHEAYVSATAGDKTVARKFIDDHKAYWSVDKDDKEKRLTTDAAKESELNRVIAKWKSIEKRISRELYDAIDGGSYDNNLKYFSEKKYLANLKSQLKKVKDPYLTGEDKPTMFEESDKIVITPDVEEEEVFVKEGKGYLHRENYQDAASYSETAATEKHETAKVTYVEDDIIPSIYRSLLVEQYLLDEAYNNLGRSYARKVNVLTISTNNNNDKSADYLMKYFVREKISKGTVGIEEFTQVSNAYKGVTDADRAYLATVNATYPGAFKLDSLTYDGVNYPYYIGTDYGDMMLEFSKIKDDINTTDMTAESDFTGSYTYSAAVGKEIKENGIKKNDYVTDGWYIKDGGLSDLPDSIKNRLFNIGVANVLDGDAKDRCETATYTVPDNESKLVAKINGKYYLKVATKQSGAEPKDDILFYENGKYYVVQIEEAVSSSKLDRNLDAAKEKYASDKKEEIINEVARVIGSNEKYQTLSTKHWLEQAELKYHDSTVYDYFKENYPDLFED